MELSIIIIAHNEGENLRRTVESCLKTCRDLEREILVVDDASTDGAATGLTGLDRCVRVISNHERKGVSPSKVLGSQESQGDVLIFLDAHCKPESDSIAGLVAAVKRTEGRAIVTPAVCQLDDVAWQSRRTWIGNGYKLNLETFETSWIGLERMRPEGEFFESPNMIGCAMAVSRQLYDDIGGFDQAMRFWGAEDADFGLRAWLFGYAILHAPQIVVGHRFQDQFQSFDVPRPHLLANDLRMARKHFTDAVWEDWIVRYRERVGGEAWREAWKTYECGRDSAEAERSRLLSRRSRDEFWYARRFGLAWPARFVIDRSPPAASTLGGGNWGTDTELERTVEAIGTASLKLKIARDQQGTLYVEHARFGACEGLEFQGYLGQVAEFLTGCDLVELRRLPLAMYCPDGHDRAEEFGRLAYDAILGALSDV